MRVETRADAAQTARVVAHHRDRYIVRLPEGDVDAHLPGRLRHTISSPDELPAVGDWISVVRQSGDPPLAIIQGVLPRRSAFRRKTAGDVTAPQVVAANVDIAFIAAALPDDINLRRIERYLTLAWESGSTPVVLLTKSDLVGDAGEFIRDVRSVAPGVDVIAVSALTRSGTDAIAAILTAGVTAVVLGSSGAGKSTLVNALLGEDRQRVGEVRDDGAGRHTTTHRELIELPGGASLIDTPGMRELQLWSAADGIEETFREIATLAEECRFRDCAHVTEPGCAVLAAVERGTLDSARLDSWRNLQRELAYLERRQDAAATAAAKSVARSAEYLLRSRLREKYE